MAASSVRLDRIAREVRCVFLQVGEQVSNTVSCHGHYMFAATTTHEPAPSSYIHPYVHVPASAYAAVQEDATYAKAALYK
eukprot:6004672-Heterocapsa_arctica.AAC.1